jgi:integrase
MASKRRTSVKGHPGVYWHKVAGGRRYEISYVDSKGRRRWKTVDGNLDDAQAARNDLHQQMRRGARVAPTKKTVAEFVDEWLASQEHRLRPRTRERYELGLRHVTDRLGLGRLRVSELREYHVAELIADMQKAGLAGWTIRATLTPLGRMMTRAVKDGMATTNPVAQLDKEDRPAIEQRDKRILERGEIDRLLAVAGPLKKGMTDWRPLLATAVYTGLRFGEVLGLTWQDVDFDAGLVLVRKQMGRDGKRVAPKTRKAVRDVVLAPALRPLLLDLKARSRHSLPGDLIFCTGTGTPLSQRNVTRRGLEPAAERAGLIPTKEERKAAKAAGEDGRPGLRFHDLRHCYATAMISAGADIVFVSEQLGHSDPSITLKVYSHEWDKVRKVEQMRAKLGSAFGTGMETAGSDGARIERVAEVATVTEIGSASDQRRPAANASG